MYKTMIMKAHRVLIMLSSLMIPSIQGIIGYDCKGEGLNITTLSLLTTGSCEIPMIKPKEEVITMQLLQLSEYTQANVIQCRIEVDRIIYYCGMHSHISTVQGGHREYIQETTRDTCQKLHESGVYFMGNNLYITGVKMNQTEYTGVTLAGKTSMDGACQGASYSDPYGTWEGVVVQAKIRVTIKMFKAPIQHKQNLIVLPSGQHCPVSAGTCIDGDGSQSFWSVTPIDQCHFEHYDVLYHGQANKLVPSEGLTPIVYTLTTQETTFALAKKSEVNICGYSLIQTEHPKLFILELKDNQGFKAKKPIAVENLDIFTYVNSKFIYVEKHIRTQLTQLYHDVIKQKCSLEKQVLRQALILAKIAPDEMAAEIMKGPGYTAVIAGEVMHIVKCIPVTCAIRKEKDCYNELPVIHQNNSYYLSPKTRILTRHGTPRDCSAVLPVMYELHGTWYKLIPQAMESTSPQIIQPLVKPEWKYVNPSELASSGIYTPEDIERLHDHIMFPVERTNVLHTIARGATGGRIPEGSVKFGTLLDESTLERIAESTGLKFWNGFIKFGSVSAGIFAIFFIIQIIKTITDTIIHGYALHEVYGCGIHLIGALWSSITYFLLRKSKPERKKEEKPPNYGNTQKLLEDPPTISNPPKSVRFKEIPDDD